MPQLSRLDAFALPHPLRSQRGSYALNVATLASGSPLRIPVHVVYGKKSGPRIVVMSTAHGYEIDQISVILELFRQTDVESLRGDLVLVPVANPLAFGTATRTSWIDGLSGDSGNMNRLWPGRSDGFLTERLCYALATMIGTSTDAVIDLHSSAPTRVISYGYVGAGVPGQLSYDISLAFGHTILVRQTEEERQEKHQVSGTTSAWLRAVGIPSYAGEIGPFYGLFDDRSQDGGTGLVTGTELGVRGVRNVMRLLGMLDGQPEGPTRRVAVRPELNLRPSEGGLLLTECDGTAVGRLVRAGTVLGRVLSPYTLEESESIVAPFENTLILAATYREPYTKVNPGDLAYIVADWGLAEELAA